MNTRFISIDWRTSNDVNYAQNFAFFFLFFALKCWTSTMEARKNWLSNFFFHEILTLLRATKRINTWKKETSIGNTNWLCHSLLLHGFGRESCTVYAWESESYSRFAQLYASVICWSRAMVWVRDAFTMVVECMRKRERESLYGRESLVWAALRLSLTLSLSVAWMQYICSDLGYFGAVIRALSFLHAHTHRHIVFIAKWGAQQ